MKTAQARLAANGDDLSALISSRICHDLINPMGAISNGIELLEAIGKNLGPELELVADSVANATSRLNFFRIAFGQADEGSELRSGVLEKIVREMFASRRFTPDLTIASNAVPRQSARTMMLILLCVESAMPLGGTLKITEVSGGGWQIEATGKRVSLDAALWEALLAGTQPPRIAAGDVHFAAASAALSEYGLSLTIDSMEDAMSLTLREAQLVAAAL